MTNSPKRSPGRTRIHPNDTAKQAAYRARRTPEEAEAYRQAKALKKRKARAIARGDDPDNLPPVPPCIHWGKERETLERLLMDGKSVAAIAASYDVSRQRLYDVLESLGIKDLLKRRKL